MLADVGRGDEDLGERDRVVGQEVEAEEILGVGIRVQNAGGVDDQTDGLQEQHKSGEHLGRAECHIQFLIAYQLRDVIC